ncbi:MAG: hypothetical protein NDI82_08205 [Anaeromyxobacteraceae bacterium]|nr:hypothetical protein [Anaeromyxobacteraceae bacterium]
MLAPLLALALTAAPPKLAVLPVAPGEGIPATTAAAITEALSGEVRRRAGAEVVTQREIAAVLTLERQKAMLGCTTDSCMAELGGALGCDRLVSGDLAKLGESFLLHLRLVETARARVVAQSDRRLRGGTIDDVLDALPGMVAELFPGAAPAKAPAPAPPPAPAAGEKAEKPGKPGGFWGPVAGVLDSATGAAARLSDKLSAGARAPGRQAPGRHTAEEPADVPQPDRLRMVAWSDGEGHVLVTEPFVMEAPLWWGDLRRLHRVRVRGGGQEGTSAMSRNFWEPRVTRGAEAELAVRDGKATLTCGDKTIPLQPVPPGEVARRLEAAAFLEPRWRRIPHALARDDEGTWWYVDGARGPDGGPVKGKPDYRLHTGRKGKLAEVPLVDALDDDGFLFITEVGRLEVKPAGRDGREAAWLVGKERRPLTWLEPSDQGRLIYGALGVYAGEALGTPCDGRL